MRVIRQLLIARNKTACRSDFIHLETFLYSFMTLREIIAHNYHVAYFGRICPLLLLVSFKGTSFGMK